MITTIPNRVKFQKRAGLSGYIADLGACFLSADLGIVPELEPRSDHASYLASWLQLCSPRHKSSNREVWVM